MQIGVYFFDSKGQPINHRRYQPQYINPQHYLCVYKTLAISSNEYSVQETLVLPTRLLTGVTQSGPFTYQAILFLNGKPIGETARVPLPVAAYSSSSATPNPSTAKPAGSTVRKRPDRGRTLTLLLEPITATRSGWMKRILAPGIATMASASDHGRLNDVVFTLSVPRCTRLAAWGGLEQHDTDRNET